MTDDLFSYMNKDRKLTRLDRMFLQYHKENPHVYELFKQFSKQAKATGRTHYSASAIVERIRWHTEIETRGDEFKINNNYRAYYARKMMEDHPEFDGFFRTRSSKNHPVSNDQQQYGAIA